MAFVGTSTMSRTKSSKSARSGLASVKRDWADSPKSSQELLIPWEPTQRPAHALTGSEARLRAIQEALAGCRKSPPPPPVSSSKRASPEVEPTTAPVKKRARQLPPDWKDDALSSSSILRSKSFQSLHSTRPPTPMSLNTSTDKKPLAAVFLSQEQTKLLKLVQDGASVFYTGSAGMFLQPLFCFIHSFLFTLLGTGKSVLLREIIKKLRHKFVKTPDAVAITASTGKAMFIHQLLCFFYNKVTQVSLLATLAV